MTALGTFFGTLDVDPGRAKLALAGSGSADLYVVHYERAGNAVR